MIETVCYLEITAEIQANQCIFLTVQIHKLVPIIRTWKDYPYEPDCNNGAQAPPPPSRMHVHTIAWNFNRGNSKQDLNTFKTIKTREQKSRAIFPLISSTQYY